MVHELKILPEYFNAVESGLKKFELRKNDRGFKEGDYIKLREINSQTKAYTGNVLLLQITYVLQGFEGLQDGWVILSIVLV
jgi:ASC-1-like (ASCH) protein